MQAACAQNLFDSNGKGGQNEREQFREMIHEKVDQWIDELMVVFDEKKQPTLMDLSDLFTATRHKLLGECLQTLIESKYTEFLAQEHGPCPKCGKSCKRRRGARKEILTMQGPSTIIRVLSAAQSKPKKICNASKEIVWERGSISSGV
jgi:hypothetical protein